MSSHLQEILDTLKKEVFSIAAERPTLDDIDRMVEVMTGVMVHETSSGLSPPTDHARKIVIRTIALQIVSLWLFELEAGK